MRTETIEIVPMLDLKPAKRCSDFDLDCADVADHEQCWKGLSSVRNGVRYETGQADGYCPYLIGMKP